MENIFEKYKQEAFEKIKDILGGFVCVSDWEISLYVDSQLEKMLKCMALNKDYTNVVLFTRKIAQNFAKKFTKMC